MPRILLLEDEPDLLEMLQSVLTSAGFEVTGTADKTTGIGALERTAFDLVLADLMLEACDPDLAWRGIDELVALARPARVGLITGWPATATQATERGVSFVLTKPCTRHELLTRVGEVLHVPPLSTAQLASLRAYFAALEAQDLEVLRTLVHADVVYRLPGKDPRFSTEIRGRDAFLEFTAQTFRVFTDPHFELGSITALPNGALVEYIGEWKEGGNSRQLPGAVLFELAGHVITSIGIRIDPDRLQ